MQLNSNTIEVLFPNLLNLEEFKTQAVRQPFNDKAINFLDALSKEINKDIRVRSFPDVATFAFFCRKANLLNLKSKHSLNERELRLGRGIVFHIAPSNVPVNFAYSLVCGILSGNINIVRVSSKEFDQVTIISEAISRVAEIEEHNEITNQIVLVRYDRSSSATFDISSFCDVRVIWGGDETISQIRKSPIPSRSFDVTFADRYSFCVINADAYLAESNPESVALGFYNDTYLFDQNACTAPHLLAWLGTPENIKTAQEKFWTSLYALVKEKYKEVQSVIVVDKLTALYSQAAQSVGIRKEESEDNLLWRINLASLTTNVDEFRCSSGYFSECIINSLEDLSQIINRKYQTLAYYGISKSELYDFVVKTSPIGIDRIVTIGHTMDFSLVWDGYDMIRTLSRVCSI